MSSDDLTSAEIHEFITKVKTLPGCKNIDDLAAEKYAPLFLRARKRDVDRAVELFKANNRMRYTENVDSIDPLEDGVRRELLSGKFTVLPSSGDDDLSATVAIFTAHRHWPPLTTHRDTLKCMLYQLDVAMMDEQSQRKGLIVLYDMRDAKYGNFDYHLCIKLLNLFKGVYPARLRKVIIVEAPIWFRAPFGVLRLFVKEKIRDRISTVDLDEMHMHLPPKLLQAVFQQLTEHHHFDWLRSCLEKTGHAARVPADYFTCPPPVYYNLNGSDVIRFNRVSGLGQRYGSLRYPYSTRPRRFSEDRMRANEARDDSFTKKPSPTDFDSDGIHPSPFSRRDSTSLNRMLSSMYNTVQNSVKSNDLHTSAGGYSCDISRRSLRSSTHRMLNGNTNNGCSHTGPIAVSLPPQATLDHSNVTDPLSPTRLAVPQFIERVNALGSVGLCAEFDAMFKDKPIQGACDRFLQSENRRRNRYLDVPCLDATAVELSDGTYLHANWVHGYRDPRAYILAQGPLDSTRRDFWMAIWEHRVPVIVMLTRIVEGQRVKCTPYWPSRSSITSLCSSNMSGFSLTSLRAQMADGLSTSSMPAAEEPPDHFSRSASYGEFQVDNLLETIEDNGLYLRTRLELRQKPIASHRNERYCGKQPNATLKPAPTTCESDQPFKVDHLLYLGWPDFDVPSDSNGFLKFLSTVKQLHQTRCKQLAPVTNGTDPPNAQSTNHPLLIHCSAGIGRTGTFVTVDVCMQQALKEGYIDVPEVVNRLRDQRAGAVQVPKQYAFVHSALASSLSEIKPG